MCLLRGTDWVFIKIEVSLPLRRAATTLLVTPVDHYIEISDNNTASSALSAAVETD
jgi:hypothetical protein